MKHGFIKVAAVTPEIKVADCVHNAESTIACFAEAAKMGAKIVVAPELGLTGYTCGDLFYQETLLNGAIDAVYKVAKETVKYDALFFVGMPLKKDGGLYNVAAVLYKGDILGFVPKTYLPNYNEFYEKRQFRPAPDNNSTVMVMGNEYFFGKNVVFCDKNLPEFTVSVEICEDMWSVTPPGVDHALAGANILVNLSASDETVGKAEYRRQLVSSYSARLACGIVYADAGRGESTTDMVFAGHDIVCENGKILSETKLFNNGIAISEIDVKFLSHERTKLYNFTYEVKEHKKIYFDMDTVDTVLTRSYPALPFVPADNNELSSRAALILRIQAEALAKRMEHTFAASAVIGISGGLDSTLSLLVATEAKKLISSDCKIICVTMPCFGTTGRTYNNACKLVKLLGAELREVNIKDSVTRHFADIGHDGKVDVTYENAQARERTQVLMDIANMTGGFVVGTGDLSELALGWATYNGDHMSMYGTNSSVPKTLVRHIVRYVAEKSNEDLKEVLLDILDTPVSPELTPPSGDKIAQKTEDIVGPYELHDFFLYYTVRAGFAPDKVYRLAVRTFENVYDKATVKKWLRNFVRRFFNQQFKRSCSPDGVKVGSVSLSPRGDWRMPSDATSTIWLDNIQ